MPETMVIEDKISKHYSQLSEKLRLAADFIIENPLDVASRSLRSIASTAGLSPATFSRLAKALHYQSYEELREERRIAISGRIESFSERAARVRTERQGQSTSGSLEVQGQLCRTNIDALFSDIDEAKLENAARSMLDASKVNLIGSLGSAMMLEYFAYMAGWFSENWYVSEKNGASLATLLANVDKKDVVLVLSIRPFAKRSVAAARIAMGRGAKVIVITDSHTFPGLEYANNHFLVRTDSSNFFSSYAAVTVILETMVGMMVSLSGEKADKSISRVEKENQRLEEI